MESPDTITWIAEEDGQIAGFSIADLDGMRKESSPTFKRSKCCRICAARRGK